MVTITVIGNKQGIYIDPIDNYAYINICKCINYNSINFEGINHVVVYREESGEMWICQAGGYTYDRGLFIDSYTKEV